MRRLVPLLSMLLSLWSSPAAARGHTTAAPTSPAVKALEAAKHDWQALKGDSRRSKYRSHWLKVATELSAVVKRYPASPEAAKALFDAGELYEDLSRVSWIQDDVDSAMAAYQKLCKSYPKHALADDAHLALARIYLGRKNDAEHARAEAKLVVKSYPHGDMVSQARALLATLPREEHEAPVATAKPRTRPALADREAPPVEKPVEKPAEKSARGATVKVLESSWSEAEPERGAPIAHPPLVDNAAIDGRLNADALEDAEETAAPTHASHPAPDRDRLAALASAVKSSDALPLSAQMGLKIRKVVIDAGHGGHDAGAIGPTGVREKDVTLAVARRLAEKLRQQGLEVALTRSEDRFVSLEGRVAFANQQRADLFISVHCNAAAERTLRGVETYTLNLSSDRYAVRLAARENASSERSMGELQFLLADIATRANTVDSRRLAGMVQSSVVGGLRTHYGQVRDLGNKEALFYVLMGTRMPAILVEGSFISNPTEEQRLGGAEFQDQLATSIASGVERFVSDHTALATAGLP
jgi:N-acetylmuramoyl-L-alanine amidase